MKNKIGLLLLHCLLLSSCGKEKLSAGVFIYDEADTFIHSLDVALQEERKNIGYDYSLSYASNSQIKQNEDIVERMDYGNPDRLFINRVDRMSSSAVIDKVSKKDIPVVFFNRQPLDEDRIRGRQTNKKIFYVGTDPVFEGEEQAKRAEERFKGENGLNSKYDKNGDGIIQLVLIKGEIGHQDSEKRSSSALSVLANDGFRTETLSSVYCNWSRKRAKETRREIREQYKDKIEVVLSNNDDRAVGAIDYLLENGYLDSSTGELPFPIFGVDGTQVGLKYIDEGYLSGTVKNEGTEQAKACIEIVKDIFQEGHISSDFPYSRQNEYTVYVEGEGITKKKNME
mgnify:CR=1 FL=1